MFVKENTESKPNEEPKESEKPTTPIKNQFEEDNVFLVNEEEETSE